jgi:chromosome segregation ATPase
MKLIKVSLAILIFFTLLVSGCVSKSNYDKLQTDLNTAQQSLTAMTTDRDATRAQLSKAQSDLNTTQQSLTAVTSDRDSTKAQLTKAQSDLTTAQQSLTAMTTDRDATKAQLTKAQSDLTRAQSDLTTAQQSLATMNSSIKTALPYVDMAKGYLSLALAGFSNSTSDALTAMTTITQGLSAANDTALKTAWDAFLASPTDNAKQAAFIKLLAQRLNENKLKTN